MQKLNIFNEEMLDFKAGNPKITLANISGIAKWNIENPSKQIDLKTSKGALFLFITALLYNYGGGGKGRYSQLLNLYPIVYRDNFERTKGFLALNTVLKNQITVVKKFLDQKLPSTDNPLKTWWEKQKREQNGDNELAAVKLLTDIQSVKFNSGRTRKDDGSSIFQHAYTSKSFLIARELHANAIWEDFPLKFCFVPDIKMVQTLAKKRFKSEWLHLFLISEFLYNELHEEGHPPLYDWPLLNKLTR